MDRAYVKLSDAALANSETSLSSLSNPDPSGRGETEDDSRLPKDKVESADENSEFVESSEEEADETSSEDEQHDIRKGPETRGRRKEKAETSPAPPPGGWSGKRGPGPALPGSPARPTALSLLHELEEEGRLQGVFVEARQVLLIFRQRTCWPRRDEGGGEAFCRPVRESTECIPTRVLTTILLH
jgi:hypothetical protein